MSQASAIRRPPDEALRVFMFQGVGRRQYVLSSDPLGRNIPRNASGDGGWTFVRALDLVAGEVRPGFDPNEAARAIGEDGYALIGCPFSDD